MSSMHVEGRMVCAVCGRVLDQIMATGEWIHSIATWDPDEVDHLPVPVEDTEIHTRERCDFCYGDGTVWVVPARDFLDRYGIGMSGGDWAACETCGQLLARNEWNGLMRRAKLSWEDRHGPMSPQVERDLRAQYRRLRKNITGAVRRIEERHE
jgi:hypothetical protein